MSGAEKEIACRRCDEVFPLREGNCPACGASVRGRLGLSVIVALGLAAVLASLNPFEVFYAAIGLFLLSVGGYALRDRRNRIDEAKVRRGRRRSPPAR